MELNEFVEKFAEQFDDTELSEFKPEAKFRELEEWSSMVTLGLIALADEEFGIRLKADDIRKSETIEELFNILKTKAE